MAQWTNLQRIKIFVNSARLYITCERSGDLHLMELGLTAGSPAGQQSSSLVDEIWARLEFSKACCRLECSIFRFV